ncbi:hypothetical protein ACO0QE_001515 [Hanseniaspora vineae]
MNETQTSREPLAETYKREKYKNQGYTNDESGFVYKKFKTQETNDRAAKDLNGRGAILRGAQMDDLKNVNQAKWVDNFNSSYMQPPGPSMQPAMAPYTTTIPLSPAYDMNRKEALQPQFQQPFNTVPAYPQLQYGYPYNVGVPFVPSGNHPQQFMTPYYHGQQQQLTQNINNNEHSSSRSKANDYGVDLEKEKLERRRKRELRESFVSQRGRRLSQISKPELNHQSTKKINRDELPSSPSRNTQPAATFFRHANVSIGKDLQIKQIVNWCLVRELDKLKDQIEKEKTVRSSNNKVSAKNIAYDIFRDFVNDTKSERPIKRWRGSRLQSSSRPDSANNNYLGRPSKSTTENYINDHGNDGNAIMDADIKAFLNSDLTNISPYKKSKTPGSAKLQKVLSKKVFIPNLKNLQNRKMLEKLNTKIDLLKKEEEVWKNCLAVNAEEVEKYIIQDEHNLREALQSKKALKELPELNLNNDLMMRIDRFSETTHLISSNLELAGKQQKEQLSKLCIKRNRDVTNNKSNTKNLSIKDYLCRLSGDSKD